MHKWVLLLRGINVGGNNRLPMKDLVALLESLGSTNVKTYIQSGNAVVLSPYSNRKEFSKNLANAIFETRGFRPLIHLMTTKEFEAAAALNPFPQAADDPKSLHLSFLSDTPKPEGLKTLQALKSPTEHFEILGKVLYLHAPDGIGRSKLAAGVEKSLGVSATGRNWRTVENLLALI